ncbi:MAG: NUDIX pyrophosphatase [Candidatus Thermoplasmatota archaeon]|nr:NUDIX pyrophosphatase [Candidatus Thermoplasmatota archaeon]MDI6887853.1 NUDIX pyrophosphatase [Candidatus Thermoplasmatota archaeon]
MIHVVSCFIIKDNKILILKRSDSVRTYKGKWATVSGYIESNEEPFETAIKEIEEEIGLKESDVALVREGNLIYVDDDWVVHPYLFKTSSDKIKTDWEHVEYKWIKPKELKNYDTVPKLKESLESVLGYEL